MYLVKKILENVLGSKKEEISGLIELLLFETEEKGKYLGMSETLSKLGITPTDWRLIKQGKLKVFLLQTKKQK